MVLLITVRQFLKLNPFVSNLCKSSRIRRCCTLSPDTLDEDVEETINDERYTQIRPRNFRSPFDGHHVLVIQPRVKWGPQKTQVLSRTTPELQLAEAKALVETLKGWSVADTLILPTESLEKKFIFGTGKVAAVSQMIQKNQKISAVFLSTNCLSGEQQSEMEFKFGVPVYDRYSIVLQIFNSHATSSESKLQIALAEIPYIKSRLRQMVNSGQDRATGTKTQIGSSATHYKLRKELLEERALKLRDKLEEVKKYRQALQKRREQLKIPTVAVMGYTNCGKTTLIKAITQDKSLEPRDALFATLDVTVHEARIGRLPQVLFVDTVGFICDIPKDLIEAFNATLREVTSAHLIIHIQDVSHPDILNQRKTVSDTLKTIGISQKLSSTLLEVGNKIDKVDDPSKHPSGCDILISATRGTNFSQLSEEIEKRLNMNMGCFPARIRVASGGEAFFWLTKNTYVVSVEPDPQDANKMLFNINFTEVTAGKFKKLFGSKSIIVKDNPVKEYTFTNPDKCYAPE